MTERRTDRVREILDLAMERPSAERAAFVAGAAAGDEQVRVEVLSLLQALDGVGDSLEPPRAAQSEVEPTQPLTGLTFGPYVVGERIGEGGMGVVYATRDTRLGRTVAVKALPPSLRRDPHRRARLEQEARLLASLNHPNIATIHGVDDTPRGPVMILEFVPGRTLAEEIASRRLSVDESVGVVRQIARGLESAHAAGIVHRDLKPANIKITPEGVVKILDLGVAKSRARAGAARESEADSTVRAAATQPGMIVGTAAYMSPEQARGRPVDRRTDLWALGCVLFEMLTGRRAFEGHTTSDEIAAVLTAEPDWSQLPSDTPPGLRRLLSRCIQKDADRRLRDAGDALLDLDGVSEPPTAPTTRKARRWALLGGAATLAGLGALAAWRWGGRPAATAADIRFSIQTPSHIPISAGACLAFSPDSRTLVYSAGDGPDGPQLHLQRLDSFSFDVIAGTSRAFTPFFSPDGRWIAYTDISGVSSSALKRVPVEGGPVQTITAWPDVGYGASWGDDDTIVFAAGPGVLWRVPASGGEPVVIGAPPAASEMHYQPDVLPGSRAVLYTCWHREGTEIRSRIEAVMIESGVRRVLVADGSQPRFARAIGMLVFNQGGTLMAAPMDALGLTLTSEARPVPGLARAIDSGIAARYAVSGDGTLAFVPGGTQSPDTDLAWFGTDGTTTTVYRGTIGIHTLRLSPDGTRVAFTTTYPEFDLWVYDLERQTTTILASTGSASFPVWTPDGRRVAFEHVDPGGARRIEWMPADGSGSPEVLCEPPNLAPCLPTSFSPDARVLAVSASPGPNLFDVYLVRLDGDRSPVRLLDTSADRLGARFSPDGTMIAYCSTETGRAEIYLHPFPALDRKIRVSVDGGERPAWSGDGRRIFYRYLATIYAVEVSPSPDLKVGKPVVVLNNLPGMRFDPAPDGTRFIMGRPRADWAPQTKINVAIGAAARTTR